MNEELYLKNKIDEIYNVLYELQLNQLEQFISTQKNQSIIIKKLDKMQEHNEIIDMVNAVFNKKLNCIEQKI